MDTNVIKDLIALLFLVSGGAYLFHVIFSKLDLLDHKQDDLHRLWNNLSNQVHLLEGRSRQHWSILQKLEGKDTK